MHAHKERVVVASLTFVKVNEWSRIHRFQKGSKSSPHVGTDGQIFSSWKVTEKTNRNIQSKAGGRSVVGNQISVMANIGWVANTLVSKPILRVSQIKWICQGVPLIPTLLKGCLTTNHHPNGCRERGWARPLGKSRILIEKSHKLLQGKPK